MTTRVGLVVHRDPPRSRRPRPTPCTTTSSTGLLPPDNCPHSRAAAVAATPIPAGVADPTCVPRRTRAAPSSWRRLTESHEQEGDRDVMLAPSCCSVEMSMLAWVMRAGAPRRTRRVVGGEPDQRACLVREHLHSGVGDSAAARRRIADRLRRALLGRRIAYTYEVAEYQPEQRLVMRTAQGPFPMETTDTWQPAESGTRMTLRNHGAPRDSDPSPRR